MADDRQLSHYLNFIISTNEKKLETSIEHVLLSLKDKRAAAIMSQIYWSFCRTFQLPRQSGNHFGFAAAMQQICGKNCLLLSSHNCNRKLDAYLIQLYLYIQENLFKSIWDKKGYIFKIDQI